MTDTMLKRLAALELHFGDDCPVCREWTAHRITTTDAETNQETGETRPAACSRCGRTPTAELQIVGMDIDDLP